MVIAVSPGDVRFSQLPLANHSQITVVDGGTERADSVLAGLKVLGEADWVLVHDAARPCLHQTISAACFSYAKPAVRAAFWPLRFATR